MIRNIKAGKMKISKPGKQVCINQGSERSIFNHVQITKSVYEGLKLRGYSQKTIKSYLHHINRFMNYFRKPPVELEGSHIREYMLYLVDMENVSRSYHSQAISAIKFLFDNVLNMPKVVGNLPRPKREKKLPVVLSRKDVVKLFKVVTNLKHKAILMMVYSSSLRVSEVVVLKIQDIDGSRNMVHVRGAKGQKDRYTVLSKVSLETLREYWRKYRPGNWIFPGPKEGCHITTRAVEKILENVCQKAGIQKHITVHTLRHSFATHLLEGVQTSDIFKNYWDIKVQKQLKFIPM